MVHGVQRLLLLVRQRQRQRHDASERRREHGPARRDAQPSPPTQQHLWNAREFAAILRLFKITEVQGDGFAGGFHADEWANHQIKFVACERTTSENYLALLPLLLQPGRVRLCDSAVLRQQLAGLERRLHSGTRQYESVSHAQTQSAHDDVAASAAGAIVLAALRPVYNLFAPGLFDDAPQEPSWQERERERHYNELAQRYFGPICMMSRADVPAHMKEAFDKARASVVKPRQP